LGGAGGSGLVVVRYLGSAIATGGTITSAGGYTIHTFNSSGNLDFTPLTPTLLRSRLAATFSGNLSGTGSLTLIGGGTLTLSGTNTYSGATTISAGTLVVNGSLLSSGAVAVASGTILTGSGSVGAVTVTSGTVDPGFVSIGTLTVASISLNSAAATMSFTLAGEMPGQSDQLVVTTGGSVTLGNATLSITLGTVPTNGQRFKLIDNQSAGAVVGTFNGLAEGATFVVGGVTFTITYAGGTGNDVEISTPNIRQLIIVSANASNNVADFEAATNARLALLLHHLIGGWASDITDKLPSYVRDFRALLDVYSGGHDITTPYQVKVIEAEDEASAQVLGTAFINNNPTFWVAPGLFEFSDQLPNITKRCLYFLLFNQNYANGVANWDPGYLILNGGGGGSSTFINPLPTTVTVGGIPSGSTFPVAQTMQQMWDRLLYPYQSPAFTSFAIIGESTSQEVGDNIAAAVTFTWSTSQPANVQPNSVDIIDVTGGNLPLATGIANSGSQAVVQGAPITRITPGSYQYKIQALNTLLNPFNATLTFTWFFRRYAGAQAAATLTEAQIEALALSALATGYSGSYAMGAGGFKYICFANSVGGQINSVKDSDTLLNVPFATAADNAAYSNIDGGGFSFALVSVTNAFGVTDNYRVYRTQNALGASITLLVT
jgi:autotransporter-associated beta strand protein